MDIMTRINGALGALNELKNQVDRGEPAVTRAFRSVLASELEALASESSEGGSPTQQAMTTTPPQRDQRNWWVDDRFTSDPSSAVKPNMREMIEAMTGRTVEEVYNDPDVDWRELSSRASSLLYGVVDSSGDRRDWHAIMASPDIVTAARKATGAMHGAYADVQTRRNNLGEISEQVAVLRDRSGEVLQLLDGSRDHVFEALRNYNIQPGNISPQIAQRSVSGMIDQRLLDILKDYDATGSGA